MRLMPPSHSAQLERLQWIRAAAAVWESPAVCRAARIWAGVGVTPISPVTALGLSNQTARASSDWQNRSQTRVSSVKADSA